MSETEKKRRASYAKRRRFALTLLTILLAAATLVTAFFGVALYRLNETIYIDYTEKGEVDYSVKLKSNDFYTSPSLPAGQSYIATLIDGINASFRYTLQTDANNVDYQYSYWLDTQLVITDSSTGSAIYDPTFPVKEKQTLTQSASSRLSIAETVTIDYAYYNELAESFVKTYSLSSGAKSRLIARMHISVLSLCEDFQQNEQSEYVITLTIPLTTQTVNVEMSSTVPNAQSKILACEPDVDRDAYLAVVTRGVLTTVGLLALLILVALLTRNKDISYAIKVKRLLSAYRSFIQQIQNPFESDGYQVLHVSSFREMLEIRDTINSPVLMYENEDKTRTQFVIPTSTRLLYVYELKVANYDELYAPLAIVEEIEAPVEAVEAPVEEIEAPIEEIEAPIEEIEAPIEEIEAPLEAEQASDENADVGFNFGPKYDYSFEARLSLADDDVKAYYREIALFARSFGAKVSRSWSRERISVGRNLLAVISFKSKKLMIAFAKDPNTADSKYRATDASALKKFERTPMLMRISSRRMTKYATDILRELFAGVGLIDKKLTVTLDPQAHSTKEELIAAQLIRPKT